MANSKLQALWNHPAGPKTIHFWAPTFKWGIIIANFADFSKPPEKVSYPQQVAVTATGLIWFALQHCHSFRVKKNWNLFSVNVVMAGTGIYQLARKIQHNYFNEEQAVLFQFYGNQTAPFRNPLRSAIPFIRSSETRLVAPIYTPFSSKICYPSWVSFEIHHSFHSHALSKRNLQFIINVVRLESKGGIDVGEDNPVSEIKKKKTGGFCIWRRLQFQVYPEAGHGDIAVLVTDKPECGGAEFAREKGIPVFIFPERKDAQEGLSAEDLVFALRSYKVDFILLAGYLKLIPTELIRAFPKSILNIHLLLLPAFGGKGYYSMKVDKAVIASWARYSGPTIHFVDEQYDTGRILAQRVVPMLANDTFEELAARVLHEEHRLYVEVVSPLCEDRIIWREDGVPLIKSKENPHDYT